MQLVDIKDLRVSFRHHDGVVSAVRGVTLGLSKGESLGIVGESGSGKSVTFLALMRLLQAPAATISRFDLGSFEPPGDLAGSEIFLGGVAGIGGKEAPSPLTPAPSRRGVDGTILGLPSSLTVANLPRRPRGTSSTKSAAKVPGRGAACHLRWRLR